MTAKTISIRESDGSIVTLEAYSSLPSTSALIREYAESGKPDRYVVFSEERELAEGGRESGVYMSILLRPSFFPSQASLLGCMSGAAMVSTLEEHTTSHLGLGWINDVYCNGSKIGSATIEGKLDNYNAYEYLIITFSIKLDPKHFPPRLTDLIVEVFESGKGSISMIIARNLISKFLRFYSNLKSPGKFMDIYSSKFILRGVSIKYDYKGKKRRCKILGIDIKTGALIVNLKGISTDHRITSRSLVSIPKRVRIKAQKKA